MVVLRLDSSSLGSLGGAFWRIVNHLGCALDVFWASQGPGRHFTVPVVVRVLFYFTGVLFNFGRALVSWARWGPFCSSEGSTGEVFCIFGAILGASWLALGVPSHLQIRGGPIYLCGVLSNFGRTPISWAVLVAFLVVLRFDCSSLGFQGGCFGIS